MFFGGHGSQWRGGYCYYLWYNIPTTINIHCLRLKTDQIFQSRPPNPPPSFPTCWSRREANSAVRTSVSSVWFRHLKPLENRQRCTNATVNNSKKTMWCYFNSPLPFPSLLWATPSLPGLFVKSTALSDLCVYVWIPVVKQSYTTEQAERSINNKAHQCTTFVLLPQCKTISNNILNILPVHLHFYQWFHKGPIHSHVWYQCL